MTPAFKSSLVCLCSFLFVTGLAASDWPHFLGPNLDLHSPETGLNLTYSEEGPKKLWEIERGQGHAGPVVAQGKVVFIHQLGDLEEIRCVSAEDGSTIWKHETKVKVSQSYGVSDAPRSSPSIDVESGLVYSLGNDGDLIAFELDSGKISWQKSLPKEFGESPFFFGYGSCPLPYQDKLIVQVGAPGACVVAFDKKTGDVIWKTDYHWNGSYASPVVAKVQGKDRLFVFAGGMVKPPHGGLLLIDPVDGTVNDALGWRSDNFASVNAASPVPCGPNRVFITEDYGRGGVMIEIDQDFKMRTTWQSPEFGCQFQTPIYHEGYIYGFGGNGGLMMAFDVRSGQLLWNEAFYQTTVAWKGRDIPISLGHAHLIHVDGAFLCLSENGALLRMELNPGGFRITSKARLFYAPETWAPPVISNGRLFINQNEKVSDDDPGRRLICYEVSGPGS